MNNNRRTAIRLLKTKFESLKDELDSILYEEQDYYDNIPESLQSGMNAMNSEDAISSLEEAQESIENVLDSLSEITESLRTRTGSC